MNLYEHGESIYNIIPPKEIKQERPPMYRSKHSPAIPPTSSTFHQAGTTHPSSCNIAGDAGGKVVADKSHGQMGRRNGDHKNDPVDYMKTKNEGRIKTLGEVKREQPELLQPSQLKRKLKADVPTKDAAPVMNLVTSKNFIVANAVETILAAPKKISQGAKDYLKKEDYGKTPKYLQQIKRDINDEYDYIRHLQQQEEETQRSQVRGMDEEERQNLIVGLKAKWESVNTEYQASTHMTKLDTFGKIKRKEKWEAELSQIEKDIEKLNRRNILVDQIS